MPRKIDIARESVVTSDFLIMCGKLMFGELQWMAPFGRELSRYHPKGNKIASNVVRAWAVNERVIPGWVATALSHLLEEQRDNASYLYEMLQDRGSKAYAAGHFDPGGTEDEV